MKKKNYGEIKVGIGFLSNQQHPKPLNVEWWFYILEKQESYFNCLHQYIFIIHALDVLWAKATLLPKEKGNKLD